LTKQWFDKVKYDGLGDTETFQATYDICRMLLKNGVPGDFVECGVFKGAHCAIMARAIMDHYMHALDIADIPDVEWKQLERRVHLFDTFAGIPKPGPADTELIMSGNVGGESAFPLEGVKQKMREWRIPKELLVYHEGFVENTLPIATGRGWVKQVAFLRIDVDLYRATEACLKHLYPLVPRGGVVCVDDFNLAGCRKAVLERVVPAPIYWVVPTK
jgi:hypothetical protein